MTSRVASLLLGALFLVTAIAFRLPHLTSGRVALDGDEAIVGLMALDLIAGRGDPVFFYGQRYGLTLFEVLPLAAAFQVFGTSPVVVKATMLALWLVGGAFTVRAAWRTGGGTAGALVGLVLASLPVWVPWSMKARGGYLTAFVASQIALCLLTEFLRRRNREGAIRRLAVATTGPMEFAESGPPAGRPGTWRPDLTTSLRGVLLGAAVLVTLLAQPLFLLPLLPLFLFLRPISSWIGVFVGAGAIAAPLLVHQRVAEAVWAPRIFGAFDPQAVLELPFRVTTALGGYYYYLLAGDPPDIVTWAGRLFAALGLLAVVSVLVSRRRDVHTDLLWATAVGAVTFLLVALWIRPEQFAYRYLLPLGAPLALLLGLTATRHLPSRFGRGAVYVGSAALFGVAAASAWSGRELSLATSPGDERGSETVATEELVAHLRDRGIAHVYVLDPMYQWNLIFASGREVAARWQLPVDRVPEISRAVDIAYAAGEPVALVGDARFGPTLQAALDQSGRTRLRLQRIADRHFVLENPPRAVLDALEFRFDE